MFWPGIVVGLFLELVTAEDCILNVETAEARAVSFALTWAIKRGWRSIMVECDAQKVVRILSARDALLSSHWESFGYFCRRAYC